MAYAYGDMRVCLREQRRHTFAAAIFPYCAFFPVSLLVFAFSTAATGTCMVLSRGTPLLISYVFSNDLAIVCLSCKHYGYILPAPTQPDYKLAHVIRTVW